MTEAFSAFGLSLQGEFALPSRLPPCEPRLPRLLLELASAEDLERGWSGPATPGCWRGRLGDGEELTVTRGRDGDFLIGYGDLARFHLDVEGGRIACAPGGAASLAWRRVLLSRVLPNAAIASGYEALHAAAVVGDRGLVALAANSGSGKSTLACELVRRGCSLFADDTVVLGRGEDGVVAHPGTPFLNLPLGGPTVAGAELGRLDGERWWAVDDHATEVAPVATVVLYERAPGLSLAVEELPATPLALAPFMLGLPDDEDRDAARFGLYADLVEATSLLRLTAEPERAPAEIAAALEEALEMAPAGVGAGR
ncbi:MAG: hypothetical protein ABW065_09920 [Solirubrobacterales bacterium]